MEKDVPVPSFLKNLASNFKENPLIRLDGDLIANACRVVESEFDSWAIQNGINIEELSKSFPTQSSCGKIFKYGDLVYRCKTCTHDDTCVLCAQCFVKGDHVDHNVTFSITKHGGGCCDCGELESWNTELNCPNHKTTMPTYSFTDNPAAVKFGELFKELLEFAVPNLSASLFNHIIPDDSNLEGCLVLFNDETHSYLDVTEILDYSNVLKYSPGHKSQYFAQSIDEHGFSVLAFDETSNLLRYRNIIKLIHLDSEIIEAPAVIRLTISYVTLFWLNSIARKLPILKSVLMEILLSPDNLDQSMMDKILVSEENFVKGVRKIFNDLFINCALSELTTKTKLGLIFGRNFMKMLDNHFSNSREPENSLIHFSVQLFTTSSIIHELVVNKGFFDSLCSFTRNYISNSREKWMSEVFNKKLILLEQILSYIVKDPLITASKFLLNKTVFSSLIECFLIPFNGLNPQVKQQGEHVLHESKDWSKAFDIQIIICELFWNIIKQINDFDTLLQVFDQVACSKASVNLLSAELYSYHYPMISVLSLIIRRAYHLDSSKFVDFARRASLPTDVFSSSLKAMRFDSEVRLNQWVLNGTSMTIQSYLFRNSSYRTYFFDAHLSILKFSAINLGLNKWLEQFISIWPLCLNSYDALELIMNIFYSPVLYWPESKSFLSECIRALLCCGPTSFTEIRSSVPSFIDDSIVQNVVSEIAEKYEENVFTDSKYKIKRHECFMYCPYFWLYSSEQKEKSQDYMRQFHSDISKLSRNYEPCSKLSTDSLHLMLASTSPSDVREFFSNLTNACTTQDSSVLLIDLVHLFDQFDSVLFQSIIETREKFSGLALELKNKINLDNHINLKVGLAKEKALKRLKSMQSSFKEKRVCYEELSDPKCDYLERFDNFYPVSNCVICQEDLRNSKENFGTFISLTSYHLSDSVDRFYGSTCRHLIHFQCYLQSFPSDVCGSCPLCAFSFSLYLPILMNQFTRATPDPIIINNQVSAPLSENSGDYNSQIDEHYLAKIREHWARYFSNWSYPLNPIKLVADLVIQANTQICNIRISGLQVLVKTLVPFAMTFAMPSQPSRVDCIAKETSDIDFNLLLEAFCESALTLKSSQNYNCVADISNLLMPLVELQNSAQDKFGLDCILLVRQSLFPDGPAELALQDLAKKCASTHFGALKINMTIRTPRLVNLSLQYDDFLNSLGTIACLNCQTTPGNPAVCLVCNSIVCFSSSCCFHNGRGECFEHSKRCTGGFGIFHLLFKNATLLVGSESYGRAVLLPSIYVNVHGESDSGLRMGRPLLLKKERLQELLNIITSGTCDTFINRNLEKYGIADSRIL